LGLTTVIVMTEPLAWVDNYMAACITLIQSIDPEAAAALLAVHDLSEHETWDDADDAATGDTAAFATGTVGRWTFIWEDNGYRAQTPGIPEQLSANGRTTATMFWNVNGVRRFVMATGGHVTRSFDPLFHDEDDDQTGDLLPLETTIDWTSETTTGGLQLLAAVSGTEPASPSWLEQPGTRYWTHRTHWQR
jgi:hypothetical protein